MWAVWDQEGKGGHLGFDAERRTCRALPVRPADKGVCILHRVLLGPSMQMLELDG